MPRVSLRLPALMIALTGLIALGGCRSHPDPAADPTAPAADDHDAVVDESGHEGPDNPSVRAAAMSDWYDESTAHADDVWSRDFRTYLLDAARAERLRWPQLMPGAAVHGVVEGTHWTSLGPTDSHTGANGQGAAAVVDSGRVNAIIPDGNRLFVATAGGGVWRRDGITWTPLSDTLGTLSCGAMAIDPTDHNRLYLGLGDPFDGTGIGVVTSTNGGDTWSDPAFLGDSLRIPSLIIDPAAPAILLAGTDKGVFRSTDAGASWNPVPIAFGYTTSPMVWSIASTGGHGFVLSAAATTDTRLTSDGQVWLSADDGATWTRTTGITSPGGVGRITVASAPSNPQVVYAIAAAPDPTQIGTTDLVDIFKSMNGGRTWTALGIPAKNYSNTSAAAPAELLDGQGWYDQVILVDPSNDKIAYFAGALTLAVTLDGGASLTAKSDWQGQGLPYVHADFHGGAIGANGTLYLGTDGGIFSSTNGGATFSNALNIGLVTHLLYSVASSPAAPSAILGGMQDNGTRLREGATSVFDEVLGGDGFAALIHPTSSQRMLATVYFDQIQRTSDGGATWTDATAGIAEAGDQNNAPFITRLVPWAGPAATGNEVYTFSNKRVYRSLNFGASWTALATVAPTVELRNIAVAATSASVLGAVAKDGRVFLSNNAGVTWTTAAAGTGTDPTALPNSGGSLSYIAFDVSDANIVYVASVKPNPALDHLWKSIDFGAHWTVIDGNGLPAGVPVNVIKSDPVPDPAAPSRVLYAGTHLGLYRSTDGGASWSRFGSGLPLVSVTDLYISPNEGIVRVATFGRGFWELQLPPRDFTIDASPDSLTIEQGASATAAISTTVTVGTAQQLALTVAGLPTGATAAFAPASITAGAGSTVTVTVGATTPPGTYALTATASGPGATHTAPISLTVTAQADFTINTNPTDLTIMQGQHGTAAVTTAVSFGATQPIGLTAIDLPAATAASFAPTTVPAGSSSTVTIAVGATAPPGTYAVTVRGTGTFASHTAALSLTVVAAPDFAISAAPDSLAMKPGTSGTTTISTTVTLGPAPTVALAISGLPAGATGTFATPTVTAGDSVALTIACDATTAPGTYPLTIQGSATATHTATVTLIVIGPPDFSLTAAPTDLTVAQGASGSAAITPAIINNSPAQVVALAVTGLPKGATGALTPTSVTTGTGATLAITVGGDTAPGSYPLTITGTGTSATHTATVTLEVIAGPGDGGCCSATPADPRGHAVVLFGAVGFAWVRRRRRAPRAGR